VNKQQRWRDSAPTAEVRACTCTRTPPTSCVARTFPPSLWAAAECQSWRLRTCSSRRGIRWACAVWRGALRRGQARRGDVGWVGIRCLFSPLACSQPVQPASHLPTHPCSHAPMHQQTHIACIVLPLFPQAASMLLDEVLALPTSHAPMHPPTHPPHLPCRPPPCCWMRCWPPTCPPPRRPACMPSCSPQVGEYFLVVLYVCFLGVGQAGVAASGAAVALGAVSCTGAGQSAQSCQNTCLLTRPQTRQLPTRADKAAASVPLVCSLKSSRLPAPPPRRPACSPACQP